MDKGYDVFISYRHDTGFYVAEIIYSRLILNGYTVFMDKNMASGEYTDKIYSAIKGCKNFISVLFPGDIEELKNSESWLCREAGWAVECKVPTIIPVMCDGFKWPESDDCLCESMREVKKNNGVILHKDSSLDKDLDKLCDVFLKNVSSSKPQITVTEFFEYNLNNREDYKVLGADMAFHAGAPWLMQGKKRDLLLDYIAHKIPCRVLINTPEAAESIAKYMRDEDAIYVPFDSARDKWQKMAAKYPEFLEVRECDIPLIHVHHGVHFESLDTKSPFGDLHIRYYAYNNTRTDNAYEHRISSFSKHYSVYCDEFEFLWNKSKKL